MTVTRKIVVDKLTGYLRRKIELVELVYRSDCEQILAALGYSAHVKLSTS